MNSYIETLDCDAQGKKHPTSTAQRDEGKEIIIASINLFDQNAQSPTAETAEMQGGLCTAIKTLACILSFLKLSELRLFLEKGKACNNDPASGDILHN